MVEVNCNGGLREKRESQSERETGDFFFFFKGFPLGGDGREKGE